MITQFRQLLRPARITHHNLAETTSRAIHVPALAINLLNVRIELNPHIFTSGRWLNNDQLHCDPRRVEFDFAALCTRVVNVSAGATKGVRYEKKE